MEISRLFNAVGEGLFVLVDLRCALIFSFRCHFRELDASLYHVEKKIKLKAFLNEDTKWVIQKIRFTIILVHGNITFIQCSR
jgi:hypothetical protein